MKTVAVKLPEEMIAEMDRVSRRRNIGRSEVIRDALRRHLATIEQPSPSSFAEQAKRYIGCVRGVRDLSSNKRHMKGYGR